MSNPECIKRNPIPCASNKGRIANPEETLNLFLEDLTSEMRNIDPKTSPLSCNGNMACIVKTLIKWGVLDARKRK